MKLRTLDTRPPQQVRVTVDGATYDKLTAYLTYAAEHGQIFEDVKQLMAEISRAFVDRGDKDFAAWYRANSGGALTRRTSSHTGKANGRDRVSEEGDAKRLTSLARDGATLLSGARKEGKEE